MPRRMLSMGLFESPQMQKKMTTEFLDLMSCLESSILSVFLR